jgi:hypothetical protein
MRCFTPGLNLGLGNRNDKRLLPAHRVRARSGRAQGITWSFGTLQRQINLTGWPSH